MNKYLFLLFAGICAELSATHIVDTRIQYEYLDSNATSKRYRITVVLTRDCNPNTITFPTTIDIGIYNKGIESLYRGDTFRLQKTEKIIACEGVCNMEALYQKIVTLPNRQNGYRICGFICCRQSTDNVLRDQDDQSYQGYMPYCSISGNEPSTAASITLPPSVFTAAGISDTIPFNLEYPSWVDSVQIRLSLPFSGGTLVNNIPQLPSMFPGFSYIQYKSGFSAVYPLGLSSSVKFDVQNKHMVVMGNAAGAYTIGYSMRMYSNGKMTGELYRECVVYVLASPPSSTAIRLKAESIASSKAQLNWSTCAPDMVEWFVERSTAQPNAFLPLNTTGIRKVQWQDTGLQPSTVFYYRVKGVSVQGKLRYSDTVSVTTWGLGVNNPMPVASVGLSMYPVPALDFLVLALPDSDIVYACIKDMAGRTVAELLPEHASLNVQMPLKHLIPGMYCVEVRSAENRVYSSKLIKQ